MPAISISRSTALVVVTVLLAILVLAGNRLAATGAARAPEVVAPLEPVSAGPAKRALVVHVVGAVRRPGLFRLAEGARVADAVARAGGATRRADLAGLNLAAPLVDGTQVLVPRRAGAVGGMTAAGSPAAIGAAPGRKVSLSSATADELDGLPGVGPITAQKILDYRAEHGPFASVDDLDAVPGIGPTRIEQLRDLVTP
ncbi:MAG: ComEA family DNA-binding protein [Gaiellaceae bacterium]